MNRVELHRHLDVSLSPETLWEISAQKGLIPKRTSIDEFKSSVILSKPLSDLRSVLATFTLFQKILDHPDTLERVAFEAIEDCRAEGTQWVELRFSPSFVTEYSSLTWQEALNSFERGIHRALYHFPDMKAGLICIGTRDYGTEEVGRTVEFYLKNRERLIGLDLAGNEDLSCQKFQDAFAPALKERARGKKINITIHAGEAKDPQNIWEAIEFLGANRIGHGITAIQDPKLMAVLKDRRICLEICPTSNWITQSVPSLSEHPLPQLLRAGIPVCINTDDPGVFASPLPREVEICQKEMGLTDAEVKKCFEHAASATFIQ